jgi:hypothetical protein
MRKLRWYALNMATMYDEDFARFKEEVGVFPILKAANEVVAYDEQWYRRYFLIFNQVSDSIDAIGDSFSANFTILHGQSALSFDASFNHGKAKSSPRILDRFMGRQKRGNEENLLT